MNSVAADTVRRAVGAPAPAKGFPWHDRAALARLFGTYGFAVELEDHSRTFSAASVDEYLEVESRNHPMAVTGIAVLEQLGQAEALREATPPHPHRGERGPGRLQGNQSLCRCNSQTAGRPDVRGVSGSRPPSSHSRPGKTQRSWPDTRERASA
jgi:hypothetical protein